MPGARQRWRQPKWPGPGPNQRGQLVGCLQGEAVLMTAHAQPARAKLELAWVRVFRVNSAPVASHRWREPQWRGPGPNRRCQLVGCLQGEAHLMTAHAWPAGAKLGLARVSGFRAFRANSTSGGGHR